MKVKKIKDDVAFQTSELVSFLNDVISKARDVRDNSKGVWIEIEKQIRCEQLDSWTKKEDWMSKVTVPLQAKASETITSKIWKFLFPRKFYAIMGQEPRDQEEEGALEALYDNLLYRGRFRYETMFALTDSVDIGTAGIKMAVTPTRDGIVFKWRNVYSWFVDTTCINNFDEARYWVDEFKMDIAYLVDMVRQNQELYDTDVVDEILRDANHDAQSKGEEDMIEVKNIDGTANVKIPSKWKEVVVCEYWGKVPVILEEVKGKGPEKYVYEDRVITLVNDKYILRNDENPYGFLPFQPIRTKPRKYDFYGKGFLENARGLQDLMWSMINLGFDSAKICAFDIVLGDFENNVNDMGSIKYEPAAQWDVKNPNEFVMRRQSAQSALTDLGGGVAMLDNFHQEATGATRGAQGVQAMPGSKGETDTLGEYQLKLQAIDDRFMMHGTFIEEDFIIPLLRKVFRIITNPKLFSQEAIDRILGMKTQVIQNQLGQPEEVQVSKLSQESLIRQGLEGFDFKPSGIQAMASKLEEIEKLQKVLQMVTQIPMGAKVVNLERLLEKIIKRTNIPDADDILNTPEERQAINQQEQQQAALVAQEGEQ